MCILEHMGKHVRERDEEIAKLKSDLAFNPDKGVQS
jgi:hypothetical protein